MIDEPLRFPLALLFAVTLHACVLVLVRVPSTMPQPHTTRSLIVHLSAVTERAAAPAVPPQAAAPSIPSSTASPAAATTEARIEREPLVDERVEDAAKARQEIDAGEPLPRPRSDARAHDVESARTDVAAVDDSAPALPTDQAAVVAARVRASYQDALADWLRRHRDYPMHLRRRGVEGDGALRLRVDRTGNVALARMETAIPDARLNALTMAMVRRSAPFPAMPDELEGETFECVIDIRYRLGD